MTVALYCRVSTDEQAQQGFSIDDQKERLEAFAKSQGWNDYEFYVDDGYTGTKMERPQLQRLLRHVKNKRIDTVVVYKLDRLSRKQKDVLHLLEDVFETHQVAFKSATEPFDTSTPLGKAMIGILAVFAQLERDTIVERSRNGKAQRTRQGLWYGGPIPYGYEWNVDAQELIVIPHQAQLVREMFNQVIKGKSYQAIGRWMDARTKDRLFSSHKTMFYMLTNPLYAGKLMQNGLVIEGKHEAIIDVEVWELAQSEISRRKKGRRPYGNYLLSNLLLCGVCGCTMKHIQQRDKRSGKPYEYGYYICSSKHKSGAKCQTPYYPQAYLEELVVSRLKELALDPTYVRDEIATTNESELDSETIIEDLNRQLGDVDVKLKRWYDAYENGDWNASTVQTRIAGLENEKRALLTRLDEVEGLIVGTHDEHVLSTLDAIGQQWGNMTDEERSSVLRAAVSKITIEPDATPAFTWNV